MTSTGASAVAHVYPARPAAPAEARPAVLLVPRYSRVAPPPLLQRCGAHLVADETERCERQLRQLADEA